LPVKYTAKPRLHNKPGLFSRQLARWGWNFSLKEELNKTLAGNEVWFDFYIQRFVDQARTPIENSKKTWREADFKARAHRHDHHSDPGLHVAGTGRFLRESVIQPLASLPEHRPLGLVNRGAQGCLSRNQQAAA